MTPIRLTAIAFAILAYGGAAGAAESSSDLIRQGAPKGISEAFYTCVDKAASAEIEEAACLSQERERQDHRLNYIYQALLRKLPNEKKNGLVEAERAWIKLQDKTSQFEESIYGSDPVDNIQLGQNEVFATCRRANELQEYLAIASGL